MSPLIGSARYRTHTCAGAVDAEGGRARVAGWVHRRRDHGGVVFIDLRDRSGILQLVFHPEGAGAAAHAAAGELSPEDVVSVEGEVVARSPETVNEGIPTGRVELRAEALDMLSEAEPLPFSVEDETQEPSEELRLTYRYLDIRRPPRQRALEMRAGVARAMRRVLDAEGFLEVETPVLTRSTPEGARDFLVPSRLQQGSWYALPQSPQLFKQLLMVGGLERYYQIVRCFRDEDLRADRQPEFTQLDVEASFIEPEDLQELIERVLVESFAVAGIPLATPFPRLTHAEVVRRFGTDRPDMRYGLEILDWTEPARTSGFGVLEGAIAAGGVVRGLVVPGAGAEVSRRVGDELMAEARDLGAAGAGVGGRRGGPDAALPGRQVPRGARGRLRRRPRRPDPAGRRRGAGGPGGAGRAAEPAGRAPRARAGGGVGAPVGGRLPAGRMERGRAPVGLGAPPLHGAAAGGPRTPRGRSRVGALAGL